MITRPLGFVGSQLLVQRSVNTDTFADGACEARSRQEEEDDAWPSSTTTNTEIVRNPHLPYGWRRDAPISLSLLLHYGKAWRSASLRELDPSRSPQTYRYLQNAVLVNFATSAAGSIRVQIQNQDGAPLPGFRIDESLGLIGDEIARVVKCQGGADTFVERA